MPQPEPTPIIAVRLIGPDEPHLRAAVRQLHRALGDAVTFDQLSQGQRGNWLASGSLHVAPDEPLTLADALQQLIAAGRSETDLADDAWAAIETTIREAEAQLGAIWRLLAAERHADRTAALAAAEAVLRTTGHGPAESAPDATS
jgi:hypothetical protein